MKENKRKMKENGGLNEAMVGEAERISELENW
jgi:hypothetical protein